MTLLSFAAAAHAADIITVRNASKRLAGQITTISKTGIVIKTGIQKNKAETVKANDILRVVWDGEPARVDALRSIEARGNFQQALDGYQKLLTDSKISNENVRKDITYFIARTEGKLALADLTKADAAIAKLSAFRKANSTSYHYYDLLQQLGRVYLAKKDYAKATATFQQLGQAPWPDTQLDARNSEAGVLFAQNDPGKALAIYTEVISKAGAAPNMKPIKAAATLGRAACLQLTGKNAQAIQLLDSVIENADKSDNRMLAGAYVLQGDCHRALNQNKDALLAYLHVDVLFENQLEYHPRALYHLSKLWSAVGNPSRANEAKQKLTTVYPNSDWAKKN